MSDTDTDRPSFEVRVAGNALDSAVAADVIEIDVHEEVNRHARVTMLVQNWNPDDRTVRHSDDGPFKPGAELEVLLGFHSDLTSVFRGVIASLTTHFPTRDLPTLRVEARSKSILLDHPARSRQLAEATDADLADAVAADYSLTADAADGVKRPAVVTDRISDWDHLKARAAELGWVTYVREDTLVLRPPDSGGSPIEVAWTASLVELHLTQDLTHATEDTTGVGWDVEALEPVDSQQTASAAGLDVGDRDPHDKAVGDASWPMRAERVESSAIGSAETADAVAMGRQRRAALGHYFGSGVVHGDPKLRCDTWLKVTGVGNRMSGPHYLTAVRHRLSRVGYRTEFQVGTPPALRPPASAPASRPTQIGQLTLGVVETLDDAPAANHVKVRLPWRKDDGDGVWARLATLDAGNEYGTVFVPQPGQEVLLGYVDGDPASPVILGSLFNGTQVPPYTADPAENAMRAIVTPGGHRLLLDDKTPSVALITGKEHSVMIDDDASQIVLTHKDSGNKVTLSGDGVQIEAVQGDIVLKATAGGVKIDAATIEGKASGPSKLESSATFDLKASGPLGLKGALVNIN